VFGPPVARAFYENTGLQWRWSYILGVIVNVVACVLYFFFYHPPTYVMLHVGGKSKMSQLKSLDWFGIFLFVGGLALFLIVSTSNIEFCSAEPRTKCPSRTGSQLGWKCLSMEERSSVVHACNRPCNTCWLRILGSILRPRLPAYSHASLQEHQIRRHCCLCLDWSCKPHALNLSC